MAWTSLNAVTLTQSGDYSPLPVGAAGGEINLRIPAFPAGESGTYRVGIYSGTPENPGFIADQTVILAPYQRHLRFTVPANTPGLLVGFQLLAHEDLPGASYQLVPEWQSVNALGQFPGGCQLPLALSLEQVTGLVSGNIAANYATYQELGSLITGMELAVSLLRQALQEQINTIELTPGDTGPKGDTGDTGPKGDTGPMPDLASPGPIGETTPSKGNFTELSTTGPSGLVLASTFISDNKFSGFLGGVVDRLAYAAQRYSLASTNASSPSSPFDCNGNTFSNVGTGTTATYTITFPQVLNNSIGRIYLLGQRFGECKVELLQGDVVNPAWVTLVEGSLLQLGPPNSQYIVNSTNLPVLNNYLYIHAIRISITPLVGQSARFYLGSYIPSRPDNVEKERFLPLGNATSVDVSTPTFRVVNGGAVGELQGEGVVAKAFDGPNRYRIRVSNTGALSTIQV